MTAIDEKEIQALAKQYEELATKGDFEKFAEIAPSPELVANFVEAMFANPEVLKRFEKDVLLRSE